MLLRSGFFVPLHREKGLYNINKVLDNGKESTFDDSRRMGNR